MMQLVDALNKAVANGDRGSMFRRTWGTYASKYSIASLLV